MFKRDIVICVREAGTNNTPIVLPIVNDSIDISTKSVTTSATRNTLGTPQFTDLTVNRGIQETTIKFTSYIKPYLDTTIKLADELLHESLFGNITTNATQLCTATTDTYQIKQFDTYLIYDDNTTFSLKNAVSISAEFVFDIQGISRIKWVIAGVDFKVDNSISYVYPTAGTYIRNRFTTAHIDFPTLNSGYDLASTNFTLSIKNTIKFPYTEVVTTRYTKPINNPIIEKRTIEGKFKLYLKVLTLTMYADLLKTLDTYSYLDNAVNFTAAIGSCTGTDNVILTMNNVILKYPKIRAEDITSLNINFTGTSALICYKE